MSRGPPTSRSPAGRGEPFAEPGLCLQSEARVLDRRLSRSSGLEEGPAGLTRKAPGTHF